MQLLQQLLYIHALIKQRNKRNGSTQSCIFDPSSKPKLSMSLSPADTRTHTSDTDTHVHIHERTAQTCIWIIKIQANKLICYVCENIIIYTITHMLLYVNLCRNMLRLKYNLSRLMTKPTKWYVRPAKTQTSLGICPIWSESSLCAVWVAKDPKFLHADSEDSDQTARMPRLICVFAGRILTLLVLSCRGSNVIYSL